MSMPQLVDTRNIGKVPNFSGEGEVWSELAFQFGAFVGAANPKVTQALKWATAAELAIDEEDADTEDEKLPCALKPALPGLGVDVQGPGPDDD